MSYRPDFDGILRWLRERAAHFLRVFDFDGMPPVHVAFGRQEDFNGITARYLPGPACVIEFSPAFIASCWNAGGGFWDLPKLDKVLLHECVHRWADWMGYHNDEAEGHNKWFLWKAHEVGLDLPATRHRWPEIIPLHEEVKLGWDPRAMGLEDWRELAGAARGWEWDRWEPLVARCRVIEAMGAKVAPRYWPRVLRAVGRLNPSLPDYKIILEIEARAPSEEWHELRRVLERWGASYREVVDELKRRPPDTWPETIGMWREPALVMEHWGSAAPSEIVAEFRRVWPVLRGLVEAIKRSGPLCRFVARVKDRFDREFNWVGGFGWANSSAHEWEDDYAEEELMVNLSGATHLHFDKPEADIYRFFDLVLAA